MAKANKNTIRIAHRILASSGVRPALFVGKGGDWTLQWTELNILARAAAGIPVARGRPRRVCKDSSPCRVRKSDEQGTA